MDYGSNGNRDFVEHLPLLIRSVGPSLWKFRVQISKNLHCRQQEVSLFNDLISVSSRMPRCGIVRERSLRSGSQQALARGDVSGASSRGTDRHLGDRFVGC